MPMTMRAGLLAAMLIGGVTGGVLILRDAVCRVLATDRDWTLQPADFADGFGPDGFSS